MKERKYVKLRTDMYEDTKFKIIDTKPERDMIHYVWTRLLTLAAKVNLKGDLFMSRNLPYTIKTLAIDFNRSEGQIKLALEVFLELEMIELIDGRIYRVKNFAKHQNIKVEEKVNSENKEIQLKNEEAVVKEEQIIENNSDELKKSNNKESKSNVYEEKTTSIENEGKEEQKIINTKINKDYNTSNEIVNNSLKDNVPILLETRKNKKIKEDIFNMTDKGERVILENTF